MIKYATLSILLLGLFSCQNIEYIVKIKGSL